MGALALKYWKELLGGVAILGLVLALVIVKIQRDAARVKTEQTQLAFDRTVENYRRAREAAARLDMANVARVSRDQQVITEKVSNDYEKDLLAARLRADALRLSLANTINSSRSRAENLPRTGTTAERADDKTAEDGFSVGDRLIATEQAIQLDALQTWVQAQAQIDPNK